jgi:predicted branched-subunit amino acid permease
MQDFLKGVNRALGVGVGYVPIAISFGALATRSGLSDTAAVVMSVWVYAGAAQFAALEGIRQNLSWLSIVLTMLLMNLRHIPMSLATLFSIDLTANSSYFSPMDLPTKPLR